MENSKYNGKRGVEPLELKEKIKAMTQAFGVSGDEYEASAVALEQLSPYVDRAEIDPFGNVVGWKSSGKPGAKKLLLDAHIDQIGFLVTQVTDEGFLRFMGMGVDQRMLPGSELVIKARTGEKYLGIVAATPPHLQRPGDNAKSIPIDEMVIDTGMPGDMAKATFHVGDFATFAGDTFALQGDALVGKAMDDRACFACILHALDLLQGKDLPVDLIIVGSTKEETGLQGARDVAWREIPDYAIAIDVCHGKTGDSAAQVQTEMAKGPVITVGANSRPALARKAMELARAQEIPYQVSAAGAATGTNAWSMQLVRSGVATLVLSLPLKYMHSPVELLRMGDVENVGKLVAACVTQFAQLEGSVEA
jgi:endoglucanase